MSLYADIIYEIYLLDYTNETLYVKERRKRAGRKNREKGKNRKT